MIRTLTQVRQKISTILKEIGHEQEPCFITQRGQPIAVMMNIEQYNALMDELEDITLENDPIVLKRVQEARANYADKEGISLQDFIAQQGEEAEVNEGKKNVPG